MQWHPERIDISLLLSGVACWLIALIAIWRFQVKDPERSLLLSAYYHWKTRTGRSEANFEEFLGQEEAPISMSQLDQSLALTAMGVLVLFAAFSEWGVVG